MEEEGKKSSDGSRGQSRRTVEVRILEWKSVDQDDLFEDLKIPVYSQNCTYSVVVIDLHNEYVMPAITFGKSNEKNDDSSKDITIYSIEHYPSIQILHYQ